MIFRPLEIAGGSVKKDKRRKDNTYGGSYQPKDLKDG